MGRVSLIPKPKSRPLLQCSKYICLYLSTNYGSGIIPDATKLLKAESELSVTCQYTRIHAATTSSSCALTIQTQSELKPENNQGTPVCSLGSVILKHLVVVLSELLTSRHGFITCSVSQRDSIAHILIPFCILALALAIQINNVKTGFMPDRPTSNRAVFGMTNMNDGSLLSNMSTCLYIPLAI